MSNDTLNHAEFEVLVKYGDGDDQLAARNLSL